MTDSSKRILPGYYKLITAIVSSYDNQKRAEISNLIHSFSIEESLDNDSIRGMVSLYDAAGFLENFPIRGEEHFVMEIEDALNIKRTYHFNIYKVNNVNVKNSNDGLIYDMYFTSKWRFEAGKHRITLFFDNPIHVIASLIFDQYYPEGKKLIKEETDGTFRCIIPNYTPMQAMNFLALRAYSQRSPSCSFRFFENASNFFFVSDEFLIRKAQENPNEIKEFTYSDALEKSGSEFYEQMRNIVTLENTNRINTMLDLYSGAYTSKVIEIDLVKKVVENKLYRYDRSRYIAMSGPNAQDVHSEQFINDYFTEENARTYIVVKDYSSVGDIPSNIRSEQYLSEIVQNRIAYRHHLNNTVVHVKINGRFDLKVGDVISLKIPNFSAAGSRKEENKQLSGKYLLNDCKNVFINDTHQTMLKLIKYDWSD
jgi:hypothetical protein